MERRIGGVPHAQLPAAHYDLGGDNRHPTLIGQEFHHVQGGAKHARNRRLPATGSFWQVKRRDSQLSPGFQAF